MAERVEIFKIDLDATKIAADINKITTATKALNDQRKKNEQTLTTNAQKQKELSKSFRDGKVSVAEFTKQQIALKNAQEKTTKTLAKNSVDLANNANKRAVANRELKNTIKTTQLAQGSLTQQRAILSKLRNEWDNLSKAERTNGESGKALQKEISRVNDELVEQEDITGRNQRTVGKYGNALQGAAGNVNIMGVNIGGLITKLTAFGAAQKASTAATVGSSKALKFFKIALIATGIGAIVIALGLLIGAFASTQKGTDRISRALRPLQVAFESIVGFIQDKAIKVFESPGEALKSLGDFIVGQFTNRINALKNIFGSVGDAFSAVLRGDFGAAKEALKGIGSEFVDFASGVENTIDKVKSTLSALGEAIDKIKKTADQLEDIKLDIRAIELRNAKLIPSLRREAEELKLIAANTLKTAAERKKAGIAAIATLKKIENAEGSLIDKQVERQKIENSLSDTGAEGLQQLAELEAERTEIASKRIKESKLIQGQIVSAIKAEIAAEKAKQKTIDKIRLDATLAAIKDVDERAKKEIGIKQEQQEAEIELLKVSAEIKSELLTAIRQKFQDEITSIDEKAAAERLEQLQLDAEAREELAVLEAEGMAEMAEAQAELLRVQQENELAQFEGSEDEKDLLIAKHEKTRQDLAKATSDLQIQSNLITAKSFSNLFSTIANLLEGNAALQKAAALFQIGVDTAKAIAGAVAQAQSVPFPANIAAIATGVTAVLANVAKAKQLISATSFAEGGRIFETGGELTGPSHEQGGIPFYLGNRLMEAEGGEVVLNERQQIAMGGDAAFHKIGVPGFAGGGRIPKFQDGGGVEASLDPAINNDIAELIAGLNIQVSVEDILLEIAKKTEVVDRAGV